MTLFWSLLHNRRPKASMLSPTVEKMEKEKKRKEKKQVEMLEERLGRASLLKQSVQLRKVASRGEALPMGMVVPKL